MATTSGRVPPLNLTSRIRPSLSLSQQLLLSGSIEVYRLLHQFRDVAAPEMHDAIRVHSLCNVL